jgi:hypothetical protein
VQLSISISDINNNLIIVRPPQIMLLMQESQQQQQTEAPPPAPIPIQIQQTEPRRAARKVGELVVVEDGQNTIASRDSAGHTAVVRMVGGNSRVTVNHDGNIASETIGPGSNIVNITQRR